MKIVIAIGGNALLKKGDKQDVETQFKNAKRAFSRLMPLIKKNKTVITHGNGPQVGNILLRQSRAYKLPLDMCVAESEGEMGYMLEQTLLNLNPSLPVTSVLTQVLVDKNDKAFKNPTKPIGPFHKRKHKGMKQDAGRGYRSVVPSPEPLKIIETKSIKRLLDAGFKVIAAGGGGIPVVRRRKRLEGVEAVIDKDKASARLADDVDADTMFIITDVPYVYKDFTEKRKPIKKMSVRDAKRYLEAGEFAEGSMKPKIEAAINFLKKKGRRVIITNPANMARGTIIT